MNRNTDTHGVLADCPDLKYDLVRHMVRAKIHVSVIRGVTQIAAVTQVSVKVMCREDGCLTE